MSFTTEDFEATLNDQLMESIGLLLGTLLTGALLSLGIHSLFLLSSRVGDRSLLRLNRLLCAYIIILLLSVLAYDTGVFVVVNETAIFNLFSQPLNAIRKTKGILFIVVGSTSAVIPLLADGVLVRLS